METVVSPSLTGEREVGLIPLLSVSFASSRGHLYSWKFFIGEV